MRAVGDSAGILAPDVLGRQLDVEHGGVNLRVPHQVLERWERDARPHHIRSEGVAEPVWVGSRDLTLQSMMAKKRAESGRRHRLTTPTAF